MDFWESDDLAEHRAAARAWADEHVQPEWELEQRHTGCHHTVELHAAMARDGLLGAGWDPEYGGTDVNPDLSRAVFDECVARGLHYDGWSTSAMVLHTIAHVGSEAQKRAYLPAGLRGELVIALGYTEPDSGSDVAAAKTTAVRDGDEWVINGQKMFTSSAQVATHVFVLARTNIEAPKHNGLTLFMVPTSSAGYERQPIYTLGGQVTNATFYSDVRIPDSARIGEVDDGWNVMKVALVYERGAGRVASDVPTLAADLAGWARETRRADGTIVLDDPLVAERIGRMIVDQEVVRVLGMWVGWSAAKGSLSGVEGSMRKLFATEADQVNYSNTLDILGAEGLLAPGAPGAPAAGMFEREFRAGVVRTVYGGTSEILRDIVAERHLGLPRVRPHR
jgi:3-oxocholest-4-en-26-oyl-CoA dehydrogenase alpha subunit